MTKTHRAWASRLEGQMAEVPSLERVMGETRRALRMHLALQTLAEMAGRALFFGR